jgi:hypothetical protein
MAILQLVRMPESIPSTTNWPRSEQQVLKVLAEDPDGPGIDALA